MRALYLTALACALTSCTTNEEADTDLGSATGSASGPATSASTSTTASGQTGSTGALPTTSGSPSTTASADASSGTPSTTSVSGTSESTGTPDAVMSFFVTSVGNGPNGGDYGGLEGADARCQMLAEEAGSTLTQWRAYLSASEGPVHARDRIGAGPWFNAEAVMVARDVQSLHDDQIDPSLMLDENGEPAGKGPPPGPEHDIITGSNPDGTLDVGNRTCADWTSSAGGDQVRVGHHDFSVIPNPISRNQNWNSVHESPCSEAGMANVLGSGRLYCFAADCSSMMRIDEHGTLQTQVQLDAVVWADGVDVMHDERALLTDSAIPSYLDPLLLPPSLDAVVAGRPHRIRRFTLRPM